MSKLNENPQNYNLLPIFFWLFTLLDNLLLHLELLTISFLQVDANCPADLSLASTYLGIFVKEFRIIEHFLEKLLICANPESNKQLQTYRQADR